MNQKRVLAELINQLYTTNQNIFTMLGKYLVKKYNKTLVDIINDMNITSQDIIEFLIEIPYEDVNLSLYLSMYLTNDPLFNDVLPPVSLDKNKAIENILESHKNYILDESNSLELRYSLFYDLLIRMFQQNQDVSQLKEPYVKLLDEIQTQTNITEQSSTDTNRIFIFTNQYLDSLTHAPSNIVRVWAEQFEKIGLKVIIVSCTPLPFPLKLEVQNMSFNQNSIQRGDVGELYENSFIIELSGNPLKDNLFEDFCNGLKLNENDTYILVGERCVQFDILPFQRKFLIPTGSKVTTTTANILLANTDLNFINMDGKKLELLLSTKDYMNSEVVEFRPNSLTMDDTIKLVLVGNRLEYEIDESLWDSLETVSKSFKTEIYIVGDFSKDDIPSALLDVVICAGFQSDLKTFMGDCHFFINPKRNGGGQSALLAIKLGLPVITIDFGDVANIIKHEYCIDNMGEINGFIEKYIEDESFKTTIDNYNKINVENTAFNQEEFSKVCQSVIDYEFK